MAKRYKEVFDPNHSQECICHRGPMNRGLEESPEGDFVDIEDYEELKNQLAKANERVKELENSFKQSIPIVDTLYALARNQLWIAYVWNDHNFSLNPEKYAKEAAESMGITNVDDANKLVEAFKQLRKEQE